MTNAELIAALQTQSPTAKAVVRVFLGDAIIFDLDIGSVCAEDLPTASGPGIGGLVTIITQKPA